MNWLLPIKAAVDSLSEPVNFFFRDDDGGWSNNELSMLIDLFERYEVPMDIAVIPRAITNETIDLIYPGLERSPQLIDVHQHGYAHMNHELTGRKCEFGDARSLEQQMNDIQNGKFLLERAFRVSTVSIFTPPWNRCTAITAHCLREVGFQALSRDRTATPLRVELLELPISIDWFAKHKGDRIKFEELADEIVRAIYTQPQVGIMLHHAVMERSDWEHLDNLLALLSTHPQVSCRLMKDILTHTTSHHFRLREPAAVNVG